MIEFLDNPAKFKEEFFAEAFKRVKKVIRGGVLVKKKMSRNNAEKASRTGTTTSQRKINALKSGRTAKAKNSHKKSASRMQTAKSNRIRKSRGLK